MHELFIKHVSIFACPACTGDLTIKGEALVCGRCSAPYATEDGIPLLFHPHDPRDAGQDVTEIVKQFYEENPFPNYDDLDSRESLAEKASRGVFAKLLDEQIPVGALVLESGCGTGQLSNFLGMRWGRRVFGTDICLNSLRLAKGFQERCNIPNAAFVQMNLFRPCFRDEVFDLVISNGVLHHTSDPRMGFCSLARLVKPGGAIIVGLYNRIGRLTTDLRRALFRLSGNRLRFLDGHMRNKAYNLARKRAWFMDQYKHPHESKHSYDEVLGWLQEGGFEFLLGIPRTDGQPFRPDERLFEPHYPGSKVTRLLTELEMLMGGGTDGALFIMIGRKASRKELPVGKPRDPRPYAASASA